MTEENFAASQSPHWQIGPFGIVASRRCTSPPLAGGAELHIRVSAANPLLHTSLSQPSQHRSYLSAWARKSLALSSTPRQLAA